jgi:hypothetical protein
MEIDIEHKDWPEDDSWRQKLPTGNPFGVPAGYFDDLSERIISGVHLEAIKQADLLGGFTLPENYFTELSSNIQSRLTIEEAAASETEGFTVPTNYFEELSGNIQSRIAIEEVLGNTTEHFTLPQGYFEELSGNIRSRIAIEETLDNTAESFTVPQGYFDELSNNIQSRVALEEALTGEGFTVPQGYFDELNSNIQSRIQLEEATTADNNAFAVPNDYFARLQDSIVSKTTFQEEAKVVQLPSRQGAIRKLVSTAAFKYASAACFALVIGVAIYVKEASVPSGHNTAYLHKELSEIPVDDIRAYLETQTDATETERKVIADGTRFDDNTLRDALRDYVETQ